MSTAPAPILSLASRFGLALASALAFAATFSSCSVDAQPESPSPVAEGTKGQGSAPTSLPSAPNDGANAKNTAGKTDAGKNSKSNKMQPPESTSQSTELATFGAGCFWCVEAVLQQLDGVEKVESGYTGGQIENPTYKQICTGTTGHAEVVRVTFNPSKISYEKLLVWFFKLHDPTTLNRQGADVGTQYRSAIFYHSETQKTAADAMIAKLAEARAFPGPIVTEVTAAPTYYPAEKYHQNYYFDNKNQGYCRAVIWPKLDKLGLDK